MIDIMIDISTKWEKIEVYCNPCLTCGEIIITDANKMVTVIGGKEIFNPNPLVICNECKTLMDGLR